MWMKRRLRHKFRQDVIGAGRAVGRLDLRWVLKVEITRSAEAGRGEGGKADARRPPRFWLEHLEGQLPLHEKWKVAGILVWNPLCLRCTVAI